MQVKMTSKCTIYTCLSPPEATSATHEAGSAYPSSRVPEVTTGF